MKVNNKLNAQSLIESQQSQSSTASPFAERVGLLSQKSSQRSNDGFAAGLSLIPQGFSTFQTNKFHSTTSRDSERRSTVYQQPAFYETTNTAFSSFRRPDQIFATEQVDLNGLMNQQQEYKVRKNTSIGGTRMDLMSTRRSSDFDDTGHNIVSEEIEVFSSRMNMNKEHTYKYPNVELKRVFEGKKFKGSNTLVSRMVAQRTQAVTADYPINSVSPRKRASYLNPVREMAATSEGKQPTSTPSGMATRNSSSTHK